MPDNDETEVKEGPFDETEAEALAIAETAGEVTRLAYAALEGETDPERKQLLENLARAAREHLHRTAGFAIEMSELAAAWRL